ncbi:WXG100 family type VII secretion target [Actinokineospora soli]|uniref:WXG100 family type VII secretion target n=1 Tax=Actinokineospora soli TaxID=1048753 RepID=A0ABW2TL72_9PSEU
MTTTAQEIETALLAEVAAIAAAVRDGSWRSGEISSDAPDQLGSTENPMSGLSSSGLDWMTQFVSFLEEPLNELRGNPDPMSSGATGYSDAGTDVSGTADDYRKSTETDTDGWTGDAASGYRQSGSQYADGLSALGEGSSTVAGAISGAAEVVGQVVGIVTGLVAEAIGRIVPIMTQAVAAAPVTFGQSIAAAIPQCVQIAVDYGQRIAGQLAALLSSGENLLKLVEGALAVMDVAKQVLSAISSQGTTGQEVSA